MKVAKYRILECTSVFRDGSRIVAYELQDLNRGEAKEMEQDRNLFYSGSRA
jgi:hypothetical protein